MSHINVRPRPLLNFPRPWKWYCKIAWHSGNFLYLMNPAWFECKQKCAVSLLWSCPSLISRYDPLTEEYAGVSGYCGFFFLPRHLLVAIRVWFTPLWPHLTPWAPESIIIVTGTPPYFHRNFAITWNIWIIWYTKCIFTITTLFIFSFYLPYMIMSTTPPSTIRPTHSSSSSASATILSPLCFTYSLEMSCPITFSALFPSSWASVIVSCMSHISTTKTFNIPCARAFFVTHLSTHTINPVTCIACSFNRTGCYSDSSIARAISLNCCRVKAWPSEVTFDEVRVTNTS